MAGAPKNAEYANRLGVICLNFGMLMRTLDRHHEAAELHSQGIDAVEKVLARAAGDEKALTLQSGLYNNRGWQHWQTGQLKQAEDDFRLSVDLGRKQHERFPTSLQVEAYLTAYQGNLGAFLMKQGQLDEAEKVLSAARQIKEKLTRNFPTFAEYQHALAGTLCNLAVIAQQRGDKAESRRLLELAILRSKEALKVEPKDRQYREFYRNHLINLAGLLAELKATPAELDRAHRDAIEASRKLAEDHPEASEYLSGVGSSLNNWGRRLRVRGEFAAARKLFEQAVAYQEKAVAARPNDPEYRHQLGNHYGNLETVLDDLKASAEEREAVLKRLVEEREKVIDFGRKTPPILNAAGSALNNYAKLLIQRGDNARAVELLERAVGYQKQAIAGEPGERTYRLHLRNHYINLGKAKKALGEPIDAGAAHYRAAIAVGEKLVKEFPNERGYLENLADDYLALAYVLDHPAHRDEEAAAYREAQARWAELVAEVPDAPQYRRQLATALHNQGIMRVQAGDLHGARPFLADAVDRERSAWRLQPQQQYASLRQFYGSLLRTLQDLGDHAALAAAAERLFEDSESRWEPCWAAGGYLSKCMALVGKEPLLTQVQRDSLRHHYKRRHWAMLAETARRAPTAPEVQWRLVTFLVTCREPKYRDSARAVELGKKLVAQRPQHGPAWGMLGMAHGRAGNWKDAIAAIETSLRLKAGNDGLCFLAMAHWHLGDKEQARRRYEEGVRWIERFASNEDWLIELRAEAEQLLVLAPANK